MDDLNGLRWNSGGGNARKAPLMSSTGFPPLRSTPPTSGRSTPLTGGASNPQSKPVTPANDSFASLVSFGAGSSTKNLSLQDQQKRLLEQKAVQEAAKVKQVNANFGAVPDQFWNNLGSGRSTPAQPVAQVASAFEQQSSSTSNTADVDDILAAFHASAPVDSSSHFPKPAALPLPQTSTPAPADMNATSIHNPTDYLKFEDDDPFGLSEARSGGSNTILSNSQTLADDDVLGLLGKPISELPKPEAQPISSPKVQERRRPDHPQDKAVAELVDMGFPADKARQALEATESGLDVSAAVGWLLNQAHEEAKQKSKAPTTRSSGSRSREVERPGRRPAEAEENSPAWMRDDSRGSSSRRREQGIPTEKDATQIASEFGNTLFKTAGSLWKQGTKKMQQVVQELNTPEADSNTPKWLRESSVEGRARSSSNRPNQTRQPAPRDGVPESEVTNEAIMLETDRPTPPPRQAQRPQSARPQESSGLSRDHSPAFPSRLRQESQPAGSRAQQATASRQEPRRNDPKSSLSRQAIEDEAATYVSSARRRKPAAQAPTSTRPTLSGPDLLDASASIAAARPATTTPVPTKPGIPRPSVPLPTKPRQPVSQRSIPNVPSNVLAISKQHRETGTTHFKRGDFSAAHASYTSALTQIPTTHPITIVILTNRALTALKIGEPKTALSDANNALTVIGPSKGESETVAISANEPPKPMREYYGKALMRKAEALEQMEKWVEAAAVWREAVDGGHGGAMSQQGRTRCEKAAGISKSKPTTPAVNSRAAAIHKTAPAVSRPAVSSAASDAAVSKLRAANAAAEKVDDERFALADSVDAKINAWRGGKADNLRALLGSLDAVLWPEAGWKKVGMSELVLPNKVKIQYMKGISKVHPDKIPVTATTEQRMIAGAVFSTLNEAWDKFKKENNL